MREKSSEGRRVGLSDPWIENKIWWAAPLIGLHELRLYQCNGHATLRRFGGCDSQNARSLPKGGESGPPGRLRAETHTIALKHMVLQRHALQIFRAAAQE
jgi:hypothetical protein